MYRQSPMGSFFMTFHVIVLLCSLPLLLIQTLSFLLLIYFIILFVLYLLIIIYYITLILSFGYLDYYTFFLLALLPAILKINKIKYNKR